MDDTISRQAAIETVRKAKSIGQAHRMLMQLPSVDAVPREIEQANKQAAYVRGYEDGQKDKYGRWMDAVPVRCKDCKHRDPEDRKCDCGHDITWQLPRGDDWYCADGERKDGEQHDKCR